MEDKSIKVSVIIPTYGTPVFLKKAIKSVLNQTLDNVELIIVDDNDPGSEARFLTKNIVSDFNNSKTVITYIEHEKNKNGAAARNTGIAKAKGKYISFLDSDDEYYLNRLEKCFGIMENSNKAVAGVYTGCKFKRNGKTYHIEKNVKEGNFMKETLACTFMFCTGSNIFVRRNIVEELNGFDEKFLRHQDYEFLVRLFKKYSLKAISEILVIKNNENFNLPDVVKMIAIKEQYLLKFKSIIDCLSQQSKNYIYRNNYILIAEQALKTKEISIAKDYYLKAKDYGSLSLKQRSRKIIIQLFNYIK